MKKETSSMKEYLRLKKLGKREELPRIIEEAYKKAMKDNKGDKE